MCDGERLYRLIYHSRNNIDLPADAMRSEIERILAGARQNNASVNITGALMFNSGRFAQVLEGPQDAITETFEKIQQDFRHSDVMIMEFGPADGRDFPNWSMAFVGHDAAHSETFESLASETQFDPTRINADGILRILRDLVVEEEAYA